MYKNSVFHLAVLFQVYLLWKSLEGDLERELCDALILFRLFPNTDFADTCGFLLLIKEVSLHLSLKL